MLHPKFQVPLKDLTFPGSDKLPGKVREAIACHVLSCCLPVSHQHSRGPHCLDFTTTVLVGGMNQALTFPSELLQFCCTRGEFRPCVPSLCLFSSLAGCALRTQRSHTLSKGQSKQIQSVFAIFLMDKAWYSSPVLQISTVAFVPTITGCFLFLDILKANSYLVHFVIGLTRLLSCFLFVFLGSER